MLEAQQVISPEMTSGEAVSGGMARVEYSTHVPGSGRRAKDSRHLTTACTRPRIRCLLNSSRGRRGG
jgi:hypothetical protein